MFFAFYGFYWAKNPSRHEFPTVYATFWGSCPNNNLQMVDSWIMLVLLLFLPWSAKYFLIFKKLANMAAITAIPKIVSFLNFVQQSHENDT